LQTFKKEDSWRKLQSEFIIQRRRESFLKKSTRTAALLCLMAGIMAGATYIINKVRLPNKTPPPQISQKTAEVPVLSKADLRALTKDLVFLNSPKDFFSIKTPTLNYTIRTHLDPGLQTTLNTNLDRLKTLTRGKPQRIAMVAMDGKTGFIKAMAGFDLADPTANPCTASDYPAASLFKIVTASAAVDTLGYLATTPMYFNGNKYTLYKRQLTEKKNRFTSRVSLASAFAESINPVFGKLGKLYLGSETLDAYARGFGFNQMPDSDLLFKTGDFSTAGSDYHLAELGCGFNRKTQISPLFGALLVSAIVNQGHSLIPRMVDQVNGGDGELIYKSRKQVYKTPIQPKTAKTMIEIMKKTISHGTARKAFRGFSRDKVLAKLELGGKTGSLYNTKRTVKYDWFTGFGKDKNSGKTLVVSVVVGHRKYIGTRASTHARTILKTYFKSLSNTENQ